jgi:hypothetical protein
VEWLDLFYWSKYPFLLKWCDHANVLRVWVKFQPAHITGWAALFCTLLHRMLSAVRWWVWRYQRGDKNLQIEMAKRKKTKGQNTIYKTLHRKIKIEQHELTKNLEWTWVLQKVNCSCSTSWHPSCYSSYKPCNMSLMNSLISFRSQNYGYTVCNGYPKDCLLWMFSNQCGWRRRASQFKHSCYRIIQ